LTKDPCDGYCIKAINTIQEDFSELYEELEFLEERIMNQGLHIQNEKSKLEKEKIFLDDNEDETASYNQ